MDRPGCAVMMPCISYSRINYIYRNIIPSGLDNKPQVLFLYFDLVGFLRCNTLFFDDLHYIVLACISAVPRSGRHSYFNFVPIPL